MKTVPHFYNNSKPVAQMDIVQNKNAEAVSAKNFNGQALRKNQVRRDSLWRFKKNIPLKNRRGI